MKLTDVKREAAKQEFRETRSGSMREYRQEPRRPEPVVADDGFMAVARGRKGTTPSHARAQEAAAPPRALAGTSNAFAALRGRKDEDRERKERKEERKEKKAEKADKEDKEVKKQAKKDKKRDEFLKAYPKLLKELTASHDIGDTCQILQDMDLPRSLHPFVVEETLSRVLDMTDRERPDIFALLALLVRQDVLEREGLLQGLNNYFDELYEEVKLDVPHAPAILRDELIATLQKDGVLSSAEAEQQIKRL